MALAVNERLRERDGAFDPIWANVLFTNLLGFDANGGKRQKPSIDLYAYPRSVRSRLGSAARSTEVEAWAGARFKSNVGSGAARTAKLIATLLHRRYVPPRMLWRIARDELSGTTLPLIEDLERPLEDLSAALRSTSARTAKLRAVAQFVESAPSLRTSWPALEPALVQPLLDWAPAVIGHAGGIARPGVMVPLMVDVSRGTKGASVSVVGTLQDTGKLERSVQAALDASCALWRNRHSNAPLPRLREVLEAKVTVDLQLIEGIAQICTRAPKGYSALDANLDLDGRSLELPIALAIYDRLVGSRAHGEVRASGKLEKFSEDEQDPLSGETYLGPVRGETAKALAAEVQLADRLILAEGSDQPSAGLPTVFTANLGAAVDQAFGGAGDGHRFVRSADIAAGFKDIKFAKNEVERIKTILKSGAKVHNLDESLELIAQTLCDVNKRLGRERFRSRGRYTFVRLSTTERADAAWANIWSAIDGDASDFAAFTMASTFLKRAEIFARQMERRAVSMADPRWSPHVLILAGVPHARSSAGLKGGVAGRFNIRRIMADAEWILTSERSPCDGRLRARIGQTRIIIVQDDAMAVFEALPLVLELDLDRAVERLSVFRYGFSFHMARRQLGTKDTPMEAEACEDILIRLQNERCEDGLPLLVVGNSNARRRAQAPTAFDYMLRRRRLPSSYVERLALHEQAAHAIAPILRPSRDDAHVDMAVGLEASWLDEAYAQLLNARRIAIKLGSEEESSRLSGLRLRLVRLGGWFITERLPAMMGQRGSGPIYDDFADRTKPSDHPALHAQAAAFATTLASHATDLDERRRLYKAALRHLNDAEKACRRLDDPVERAGAEFLVSSERCRLAHVGRSEPDDVLALAHRDVQTHLPLALARLPNMRELYWVEWFNHVGALVKDNAAANRVYRAGLWNESLPGEPQVGDETLIGWAGTLDPRRSISPKLLNQVREHLKNGFFRRRRKVQFQAVTTGERLTVRTLAGMKRLSGLVTVSRR